MDESVYALITVHEKKPINDPWAFDVALMDRFPAMIRVGAFPVRPEPLDLAAVISLEVLGVDSDVGSDASGCASSPS